jgi:phenylacetate-CoA ligase
MGTLPRLHGSWTVARQIPGQRRAPWLDPERIAALRDRRVRSVVGYAAAHVPHYRDAFRAEGLDPREIRTADDLARLPLVTKGDVQRDPARFVAETRSGREAIVFRTSGSTGVPLAIAHDRRSMLDNIPHSERERVVETALCGKRVRYRVVVLGPPDQSASKRVQAFYADATLRPVRPDLQHLSVAEPVERSVVELNRRRPDVIRGYGSYLEALFRRIDARGLPFEPPRVVVVAGDGITREGKALIEERFGIPVVER